MVMLCQFLQMARLDGDAMIITDLLPATPWNLVLILVHHWPLFPASCFHRLLSYYKGGKATAAKNLANLLVGFE